MNITVTVALGEDDTLLYAPDAAAAQVLAALGADPTKDYCTVTVQQDALGTAGVSPEPPPPAAPPPHPFVPPET